jgi:hypothetical protein
MRPATDVGNASIRLVLFGPNPNSENRWTSTVAVNVPNDGAWRSFLFSVREADLTLVTPGGPFSTTMNALNRIMFRHDADTPSPGGDSLSGTVGFDNIEAVPEPGASLLAVVGMLAYGGCQWWRRRPVMIACHEPGEGSPNC